MFWFIVCSLALLIVAGAIINITAKVYKGVASTLVNLKLVLPVLALVGFFGLIIALIV